MIITRKRFQKELLDAREQAFNECMKRRADEERIRCLHERIDRLERMVYDLQSAVKKPEEIELTCCKPVRG